MKAEFVIEKNVAQKGKTFSKEAIMELGDNMVIFVVEAVAQAWEDRQEPPTYLKVEMEVTIA